MATLVTQLFAGQVETFGEGGTSAIVKQSVDQDRWLDSTGVAGDEQADHGHHAGPDRALNHFPVEHYPFFAQSLADTGLDTSQLLPGAIGENISTRGLTEADVHVGDVFQLGEATIQITQPRQPCWKIGVRLNYKPMARALIEAGRAGWLYRVLEPGDIRAGDSLTRVEPAEHGISISTLWACQNTRQPSAEQKELLTFLVDYPLLAADWRRRLARKLTP